MHTDPIGAILISIYIIYSWFCTGMEQLDFLVGRSADPEFLVRRRTLPSPSTSTLTLTLNPLTKVHRKLEGVLVRTSLCQAATWMAEFGARAPGPLEWLCRVTRLLWLSDKRSTRVGDLTYLPPSTAVRMSISELLRCARTPRAACVPCRLAHAWPPPLELS